MIATDLCLSSSSAALDHARAPLWENMVEFRERLRAPFYCPGHKGGRSLPPELSESFGAFDLNNLPDTDTLHCPSGPIGAAEELLTDAYGVTRSFMMVGGSSLGNMSAIMSVAGPGETVLVQRNAHKSVVAGLIHAGAIPKWIIPQWDNRFGISHGVSVAAVERAIQQNADARALLVLNPTYFGVVPDFISIAKSCRQANLTLIADEAHGPHFRFGPGFPVAAENAGADIVVQSTHKILSGLSQAAVLHLCGKRVDSARVQAALQSLQTTSPNFAIMASIDLARRQMMQEGSERLRSLRELAEQARSQINAVPGCRVLDTVHALGQGTGFFDLDKTKLVIDITQTGWTGSDAQKFLNRKFGVQPELSGPGYLLCIMTVGSIPSDVNQLMTGLRALSRQSSPQCSNLTALIELAGRVADQLPQGVLSPREAFYARHQTIPFSQALGRISGEIITPYPPGIPVMMPGERFDQDSIELLAAVRRSRCPISAVDPQLETVRVVQ